MALKKADIEKFKSRLMEMKGKMSNLVRDAKETVKASDDVKGYSQHQADEGTEDFDRIISLEVTSKEYSILKQIDRALEKIHDGSYGKCDVTGEDIPLPRLEAIPYATMTVKAQEKMEKGLL